MPARPAPAPPLARPDVAGPPPHPLKGRCHAPRQRSRPGPTDSEQTGSAESARACPAGPCVLVGVLDSLQAPRPSAASERQER